MKGAHRKTLEAVFSHPLSANIAWKDIEALLIALGAAVSEREGSRIAVVCSMKCVFSIGRTHHLRRIRAPSRL
jgi:hypothetical protein